MTQLFSVREKEIFDTLKQLEGIECVVIGGYAVNAYALPCFSVDCDLVIHDRTTLSKIDEIVTRTGYAKEDHVKLGLPYHANFARYEKGIEKGFRVSLDILIGEVSDRRTGASFSADWIFFHSSKRPLRGKTILDKIEIRVADPYALVAMKWVSCRINDIRDVFMLMPEVKDGNKLKEEIGQKTNFKDKFNRIKAEITSEKFRNSLHGVFGYLDPKVFEKHKKAVLEFGES